MCTFFWLVSFICSCYVIELGFRCRLANCFPNTYYVLCFNNCSLDFKSSPHCLGSKHPCIELVLRIIYKWLERKQRRNPMDVNVRILFTSRCDSLISQFILKGKSLMFSLLGDNNSELDLIKWWLDELQKDSD